VKHYLSLFFALALLVPSAALAQTDEADDAPAQDEQGDAEPAQVADDEDDADAADEDDPDAAEDAADQVEEAADEAEDAADEAGDEEAEAQAEALEEAADDAADAAEEAENEPVPQPAAAAATAAPQGEGDDLGTPSQPSLADDLAAAQAEGEPEEDDGLPPPEQPRDGLRYDVETGRFVEETEQLPWRNSLFLWDNEVGTYTLDPGLSENPYYSMAFSLRPRWYFTDAISLRLRQDLTVEWTDTDSRVRNREPVLQDTLVDIFHSKLVDPAGIVIGAGARLTLPTSYLSRNNTMIAGTGLLATATKSFEVLQGLAFQASATYNHYWFTSNVPERETAFPCHVFAGERVQDNQCLQSPGSSNIGNVWGAGLAASLAPIENLTFETSYSVAWRLGHDLATGYVETLDGTHEVPDGSDTHWRNLQAFSIAVDYRFTDWISLTGSFYSQTTQLNPDGSLRNPLYNPDSAVSLTATLTLDQLYTSIARRTGEDDAGAPAVQAAVEDDRAVQ